MKSRVTSDQYVPVLRWKAAEVKAVSKLDSQTMRSIHPIWELCPSAFISSKRTKNGNYVDEIRPIEVVAEKLVKLKAIMGDKEIRIDLANIKDGEAAPMTAHPYGQSLKKVEREAAPRLFPRQVSTGRVSSISNS